MGLLDKIKKSIKKSSSASADAKALADKKVAEDKGRKKEAEQATKVSDDKKLSMKELYESKKVGKAKKTGDGKKSEKKKRKYGNAYRILVKPLVTEKATNLGSQNKYVFAVSAKSNKIEIVKAINEVYGIKPIAVNIIKMQGKKTRYGKVTGRTKDWKKAVITLPEGETIKVYEGV